MKKPHKVKPLPIDRLREAFSYDPETGVLTRLITLSSRGKAGDEAGTLTNSGHLATSIDKRKYLVHRIAWALHYGEDPGEDVIDHIDHDPANNKITNLRRCQRKDNLRNRSCERGYYKCSKNRWAASIRHNDEQLYIGIYECPLLARLAYVDKARELRGEFAAV